MEFQKNDKTTKYLDKKCLEKFSIFFYEGNLTIKYVKHKIIQNMKDSNIPQEVIVLIDKFGHQLKDDSIFSEGCELKI